MQNGQAVETVEITVQFVNDPKPGKKWGSVKDTAGNYYGGPPAMIRQFKPGETCKIDYTLGGNDGTLKALKHKYDIPAALQRHVAPPPRARTNPGDSEQIFVCALIKPFIEVGAVQLQRDSIKAAINELRASYADTFGSPQKQQSEGEFNDSIPF